MILIFCAFGAEFEPLRKLIMVEASLQEHGLRGCRGRIGDAAVALVSTGVGVRRARESSSRALIAFNNVELVIASGVAGALSDDLPLARVVLADRVMAREDTGLAIDGALDVSRGHAEAFARALDSSNVKYSTGAMLTSRRPIMTANEKQLAHRMSGAIGVDMESAAIALEARARGLLFVCLRTVLDTAAEDLPLANLLDDRGRIQPLTAAKALFTHPGIVLGLPRFARNLRSATRSLAAAMQVVLNAAEVQKRH
jgi:adenosylhomocysteine nucleosidase